MAWSFTDVVDPGDVFGGKAKERANTSIEALEEANVLMNNANKKNRELLNDYLAQSKETYENDAQNYDQAKAALTGLEAYTPDEFTFDKTEQDYFDKFYNQRVAAANRAIKESSDGMSSSYLDQLAAKQQALASDAWSTALDKYNQARSQALNEYTANVNAQNTGYTNQLNAAQTQYNIANDARNKLQDVYGNYYSQLANQNNISAQNAANLATNQAQVANANNTSILGRIFG